MTEHPPRKPNDWERQVFSRLTETDYPGRDEIRACLVDCVVRETQPGLLEIEARGPWIPGRGEIEAVAGSDEQGRMKGSAVFVELVVSEGKVGSLHVYRADGEPLHDLPDPQTLLVKVDRRDGGPDFLP